MQILVKNASLDNFLAEVARAYCDLCPAEAQRFIAWAKTAHHALLKPTGMSPGGHFMVRHYIPANLYHFVRWQARKRLGIDDFFRDPANYDALARVFTYITPQKERPQIFSGWQA